MSIVLLTGSPGAPSRVATLVAHVAARLRADNARTAIFGIDHFDPAALIYGNADAEPVRDYLEAVAAADALVVATPVYQSSFSGALKLLLDLIPQNGLRGKIVLPIAAGGSAGHLLALDYALKPVLGALGADSVLAGVYASGGDLRRRADVYEIQHAIRQRLDNAADELAERLRSANPVCAQAPVQIRTRPRLFADDGMTFPRRKAIG